jgi:hypothetical protein
VEVRGAVDPGTQIDHPQSPGGTTEHNRLCHPFGVLSLWGPSHPGPDGPGNGCVGPSGPGCNWFTPGLWWMAPYGLYLTVAQPIGLPLGCSLGASRLESGQAKRRSDTSAS